METKISRLLLDEHPLVILPKLAVTLGSLNEAVILQQVHYWIKGYEITQFQEHFHRGRYWVYNSYHQWKTDNFPFWSEATIKRTFNELSKKNLILSANFNKDSRDKTKWYTINYEQLAKLAQNDAAEVPQTQAQSTDQSSGQIDQTMRSKCTDHKVKLTSPELPRKPLPAVAPTLVEVGPETTTETTTEITNKDSSDFDKSDVLFYVQSVVDFFNSLKSKYPDKIDKKVNRPKKQQTVETFSDKRYRAILKWHNNNIALPVIFSCIERWIKDLPKERKISGINYFENYNVDKLPKPYDKGRAQPQDREKEYAATRQLIERLS